MSEALGHLYAAAPARLRADAAQHWPDMLELLPNAPVAAVSSVGGAAKAGATNGPDARRRLYRQLTGFVEAVAATRPVALLLDDVHWADAASLDCLLYVARHTRGARVLLLGTYRDQEVRHQPALRATLLELVHERLVERIAVRPLALDGTAALMSVALRAQAADELAGDLVQVVQRTTQGNPFFVQEIVRALVERGEIAHQDGAWRRAGEQLGEVALPESVRDTLIARVARLSPLAQAVLGEASVLGPVFTLDPLTWMGGWPVGEVEAALEEGLAAELIREAGGVEYGFSHALTQRAIYTEIPAPRRRRLHRAAGEALERLPESERGRRAAELARHFLRGDMVERALPYVLRAGERAVRVHATEEAYQHLSVAADLAGDLGDQYHEAMARERRADVLYLLGRMDDAYADLACASRIYRATHEWERLTWATCLMAKVCDQLGRTPESMRFMDELLATLMGVAQSRDHDHSDDPNRGEELHEAPATLAARAEHASTILSGRATARLFLCLTSRLVFLGRFAEALDLSGATISHARQAEEPRLESLAHAFRASAQQAEGDLDAAIRTLEEARRTAEVGGDLEARFLALNTLANIHELRGEPRAVRATLPRALEALTLLDDTVRRSMLLSDLGWNAFVLGEWRAARDYWTEALAVGAHGEPYVRWYAELALLRLDITEGKRPVAATLASDPTLRACQQGDPELRSYVLRNFAEAELLTGAAADLRDRLRAVREDANQAQEAHVIKESEISVLLAWVELELGNEGAAARELTQARQHANAQQNRAAYAEIWRIEALLAVRQCRWDDAIRVLEQALALCRAMPHPYAEARALYVYGLLHVAKGEPELARARYQAALVILRQLGERLYAEHIERALAELAARV
jgi:tetratricopeptide (TPR) repeat protein